MTQLSFLKWFYILFVDRLHHNSWYISFPVFHHDKSYGSGWVCYITHRLQRDTFCNYFEQDYFKYSLYKCILQELETSDPLFVLSICSFGLDNGRSVLERNLSNVFVIFHFYIQHRHYNSFTQDITLCHFSDLDILYIRGGSKGGAPPP